MTIAATNDLKPSALLDRAPIVAAPAHAETAVAVHGLVKRFRTGAPVIDGLTLAIGVGSRIAVIGANGTGKSTLVRMLVRLVEPDAGVISVLGSDVRQLDARRLRSLRARVGFVFQRHNLVTRLSALSNVIHGAQGRVGGPRTWLQALSPRHLREEAMDCLDRVGLADKALSRVDTLSGGQSQRVAVARMLMQRPTLVSADEPCRQSLKRTFRPVKQHYLHAGLHQRLGHRLDAGEQAEVVRRHLGRDRRRARRQPRS